MTTICDLYLACRARDISRVQAVALVVFGQLLAVAGRMM